MIVEKILFEGLLFLNLTHPIEQRNTNLLSFCDYVNNEVLCRNDFVKSKFMDNYNDFAFGIKDKEHPDKIIGLFVPKIGIYEVVQQLEGNNEYISPIKGIVTQFSLAEDNGVIGLLSHNYFDGDEIIEQMQIGDIFALKNGGGDIVWFKVDNVDTLVTLKADDSSSDFIDPSNGNKISVREVFKKYYSYNEDEDKNLQKVIFQTCVYDKMKVNMGRIFVEAWEIESPNLYE